MHFKKIFHNISKICRIDKTKMVKLNYFIFLLASFSLSFLLLSTLIMMANAARLEALDEMTLANPNESGRKKAAHDNVQKKSSYSGGPNSRRPKSGGSTRDYGSGYYSGTGSYYYGTDDYSMQGNTSGGSSSRYSAASGRRRSSSGRERSGNSKRRTSGGRNSNATTNSMAIVPYRRTKSGGGESSRRSGYSHGKNQLVDSFGAMTLAGQGQGSSFGPLNQALTQRQDDAGQIEKDIQQKAEDIQKQYLPSVTAFRDQFYPNMKLVGEPGGPPIKGGEPPLRLDGPPPFVVEGACNGPSCRPSSSQLLLPPPPGKTRTYSDHKSGKLIDGSDYTSGYVRTRSIGGKNSRDGYYSSDYSYYTQTSPGASKYFEGRRKSDSRKKSSERKKDSIDKYDGPRSSIRKSGDRPRSSSRGRGTAGESEYRRKKSSGKERDSRKKSSTGESRRRKSSTRERDSDSERTRRHSKGTSSYYQTDSYYQTSGNSQGGSSRPKSGERKRSRDGKSRKSYGRGK